MKRDLLTTVLLLGLLALCGCERGEAREIALVVAFYAIPALLAVVAVLLWGMQFQLCDNTDFFLRLALLGPSDCTEDEFVAALKAQHRTIRRMAAFAADPQAARDEIEAAALARWRELRSAS